ncbi:DUF2993 domain-containing protein [Cellulomonas endophytica]|uniref:LmeA family phospholipid-binding protein n=1 Tax=Cellulomonas endophytica TaxID=2494735 RepID=UPI0013E994E2|nr:DUF2993 domain-containing protein [Cellulomonas endophytica]
MSHRPEESLLPAAAEPDAPSTGGGRRRRRGCLPALVALVLLLVLLAVGALLADRWARGRVEDRVVAQVDDAIAGEGTAATVEGFPVLTQIAGRSLDRVRVTADAALVAGVRAEDVRVDARDVGLGEDATVRAATLQASLPEASVQALVDRHLAGRAEQDVVVQVRDGVLTARTEVVGVDVGVDLAPTVVDGTLVVDVTTARVAGTAVAVEELPGSLAERLQDLAVPVEGLPAGLELTGARVVGSTILVEAVGTDVRLEDAGALP